MKSKREVLSSFRKSNSNRDPRNTREGKFNTISESAYKRTSTIDSSNFSNCFPMTPNVKSLEKLEKLNSPIKTEYLKSFHNTYHNPIEESIEIKIPTPYPQTQYMLIEDPNLLKSKYTEILNEKYPARKFLKHNLTSWNKCNKSRLKSEMNVKFLNPKIKLEDYNLKKLLYKGEDIDAEKIVNLDDALNIVELLKAKLVEYELTNNQNIETSMEYINSIKLENDFLKNKLVDNYDKINRISENLNIDVDDILYDNKYLSWKSFRDKWLKFYFYKILKKNMYKNKVFNYYYKIFKNRQNKNLKLKAILSLEKYYMVSKFFTKNSSKKLFTTIRKIFESLRFNLYVNKISRNFKQISRTISLMVMMKEFKLNLGHSKYFNSINKKGLFKYYISLTTKALRGLKMNSLKFRSRISISNRSKINFLQFFKDFEGRFKDKNISALLNRGMKNRKVNGLILLKKIVSKSIDAARNKIINHPNPKFPTEIYFKKWKDITWQQTKELEHKICFKKALLRMFFNKSREVIAKRRSLKVENMAKFYVKRFLHKIGKEKESDRKISNFRNQSRIFNLKMTFESFYTLLNEEPIVRSKRIFKKFELSYYIDKLRRSIVKRRKSKKIHKIAKKSQEKICKMQSLNDISSFFKKSFSSLQRYKRSQSLINLFKSKYAIPHFYKLRQVCLHRKIKKQNHQNAATLNHLNSFIKEKNELISKLESDNSNQLSSHRKLQAESENLTQDNYQLRKKIAVLESKIESDNLKFRELWNQNVKDIKNLQETLHNNEELLTEAMRREEQLQHKYCTDIENAIKLNKQLNTIVSKKNKMLADIKIKQHKNDEEKINEQKKLYKENASLFNDYAKIIELKEREKRHVEEEKLRMRQQAKMRIEELEEQKLKSEYKAKVLETENKDIFSELVLELGKRK